MSSLDIRPVEGSVDRTKGWFVSAWHQLGSFTPGCNWRDFTLVHLGGEWNHQTERAEIEVAILGLWLRVTYVWGDEFVRGLMDIRDDFRTRQAAGEVFPTLDDVMPRPPISGGEPE